MNSASKGHAMKRGTMMILKRILMTALGVLGVAMLGARADIPAPEALTDIAACIRGNTPPASTSTPDIKDVSRAPGEKHLTASSALAALFAAKANTCVPSNNAKITINMAQEINAAAARFLALDPKASTYDADAEKARKEYSGPIMDALWDEVAARRTSAVSKADYDKAQAAFILTTRNTGDTSGAERARYHALEAGTLADNDAADIAYKTLTGHTITISGAEVTAVAVANAAVAPANSTREIETNTAISEVIGWRDEAETALEDINGALNAVKRGGVSLRAIEVEYLNDAKKFREEEIKAYDDLIEDIEQRTDTGAVVGTNSYSTIVSEYRSTVAVLDGLQSTHGSNTKDQKAKNTAVRDKLIDADSLIDTIVSLADQDYSDASGRGLTGDALKSYDDVRTAAKAAQDYYDGVVGDSGSPAVDLLKSVMQDKDTGGALVSAVADTYGTAKQAADDASAAKTRADEVASSVDGLTGEGGAVAMNTAAIATNTTDIATNKTAIAANTADIATNKGMIMTNTADIATNKGMIETNMAGIATNKGMIETNTAGIGANTGAIADNANAIGSNSAAIQRNSGMIGELSESLETVRAGVAASMALAGMPAINGRGISIGVGSFDGESAFAVGFMIQGEMASFKVGVTSAGGATGASAGVGFQF